MRNSDLILCLNSTTACLIFLFSVLSFQAYISRVFIESFSLTADSNYVAQNIGRICRAFFELSIRRGNPSLAASWLKFAIAAERRVWPEANPLRQFDDVLSAEVLLKLEYRNRSIDYFKDMTPQVE